MREKKNNELIYYDKERRKIPLYWFYVPLDKKVNNIGNIQGKFNLLKESLELKIESPFYKKNKKELYFYKDEERKHDYYVLNEEYVMEITKRLLSIKNNIPTKNFTRTYISNFGDEYKLRTETPKSDTKENNIIIPGEGKQRHRYRQRRKERYY